MYVTISVNLESVLCDIDALSIASTHHRNVRPAHRASQGKSCCGAVSVFSHDSDINPSIVPLTLWQRYRRLASLLVYQRVSSERLWDGNLTCGRSDLRVLTSLAISSTATEERLSGQREEDGGAKSMTYSDKFEVVVQRAKVGGSRVVGGGWVR